jgi:hypothetical protein
MRDEQTRDCSPLCESTRPLPCPHMCLDSRRAGKHFANINTQITLMCVKVFGFGLALWIVRVGLSITFARIGNAPAKD